MKLNLESLETREVPTVAFLSNGQLTIIGDNFGNSIDVLSNQGVVSVTERGVNVPIFGAGNVTSITEIAGTGYNNTLQVDVAVASSLVGNGEGVISFLPNANAPCIAQGSQDPKSLNYFRDNPGGKDTFVNFQGQAVFDWEPGTGSDVFLDYTHKGVALVVGNSNGIAEQDTLFATGGGWEAYQRLGAPLPFRIDALGISDWYIVPSTGVGNTFTQGDLTGTDTKFVDLYFSQGVVDASLDFSNALVRVHGRADTITAGNAGATIDNKVAPSATKLIQTYSDISLFLISYRSRVGMQNYTPYFDFDGNGAIDSTDYYQFLRTHV